MGDDLVDDRPGESQALTAKDVVEIAISENRDVFYTYVALIVLLVLVGTGVLVWGIITNRAWAIACGTILDGLCLHPLYMLRQCWRENVQLRLLIIPISMAETAEEASRVFLTVWKDSQSSTKAR